jgi:hypothetical protein
VQAHEAAKRTILKPVRKEVVRPYLLYAVFIAIEHFAHVTCKCESVAFHPNADCGAADASVTVALLYGCK